VEIGRAGVVEVGRGLGDSAELRDVEALPVDGIAADDRAAGVDRERLPPYSVAERSRRRPGGSVRGGRASRARPLRSWGILRANRPGRRLRVCGCMLDRRARAARREDRLRDHGARRSLAECLRAVRAAPCTLDEDAYSMPPPCTEALACASRPAT
jgi:hypothetical protein